MISNYLLASMIESKKIRENIFLNDRMVNELVTIASFIVGWIISTIIIFLITRYAFREEEGVGRAALAAVAGTVIYSISYYLLGTGILAAVIGGIVWLFALRSLYKIGWLRALLIAIVIWVVATIVGFFLPTLGGPI